MKRLQQMVLDTYAVDLLPIETMHEAGFWPDLVTPAGLGAAVRHETRELVRGRGAVLAVVLSIVAFLVLRAAGFFGAVAPSPAVSDDMTVQADVSVQAPVEIPLDDVPKRAAHRVSSIEGPKLRFGVVCGERVGDVAQVMPCWRPTADLLGLWNSPPDAWRACRPEGVYSRRASFSVCWLDFGSGADKKMTLAMPGVHRWDLPS